MAEVVADPVRAHLRALKRQGASLAADRNAYADAFELLEDRAGRLFDCLARTQGELRAANEQLNSCRDLRHKLLVKLRDAKSKNESLRAELARLKGED